MLVYRNLFTHSWLKMWNIMLVWDLIVLCVTERELNSPMIRAKMIMPMTAAMIIIWKLINILTILSNIHPIIWVSLYKWIWLHKKFINTHLHSQLWVGGCVFMKLPIHRNECHISKGLATSLMWIPIYSVFT